MIFNANRILIVAALALSLAAPAQAIENNAAGSNLLVPVNRSVLLTLPSPMSQVVVQSPDIADVKANNSTHLTIIGKRSGHTNIRILDKKGAVMRDMDVEVGQDLPAIRKALKNFLPDENIGVEMVNSSVALTGRVSSQVAADKAMRVAQDYVSASKDPCCAVTIVNFMQINSGQQVMLRVRVGEIQRTALKNLGIDLNVLTQASGAGGVAVGTGTGLLPALVGAPGVFTLPAASTRGIAQGTWQPGGVNGNSYSALISALEQDGLFKTLAEPNLVAASGEEAEFLSGGEIPIPVVQNGNGNNAVGIDYKPFGVSVKFTPNVLSENRIRVQVRPEVSEVSSVNAVTMNGFNVPSFETRRAKTTVELAPGESFMIAGLISDQTRANIRQIPGAKELPILGALFRSSSFQRNETELVIAVTPYVVDPLKSADVKLPTDDFQPASQADMVFFGALGGLNLRTRRDSQAPLEGPIGFMVD